MGPLSLNRSPPVVLDRQQQADVPWNEAVRIAVDETAAEDTSNSESEASDSGSEQTAVAHPSSAVVLVRPLP